MVKDEKKQRCSRFRSFERRLSLETCFKTLSLERLDRLTSPLLKVSGEVLYKSFFSLKLLNLIKYEMTHNFNITKLYICFLDLRN